MRIHTYSAGSEAAVSYPDVAPEMVLHELLSVETDEAVYRVDDEVEIDVKRTVIEIFGTSPGHVIVHSCRKIAVTVSYAGRDTVISVHPTARVKRVRAKAIESLDLDAAASADLVLRLPGATADLPLSHPIGAFVPKRTCGVILDLIHQVRAQG